MPTCGRPARDAARARARARDLPPLVGIRTPGSSPDPRRGGRRSEGRPASRAPSPAWSLFPAFLRRRGESLQELRTGLDSRGLELLFGYDRLPADRTELGVRRQRAPA